MERDSLGVFDCAVHRAEKSSAIFHQAVKVYLVQEITPSFTEIIYVIPENVSEKDQLLKGWNCLQTAWVILGLAHEHLTLSKVVL